MHIPYALYIGLYLVIAMASFAISLLVYMRKKKAIYRYFSIFAVFIALWQLLGLAAQAAYQNHLAAILLLQTSITASCLMAVFMLAFSLQYAMRPVPLTKLLAAALVVGLSLTFSSAVNDAQFGPMMLQLGDLDIFYTAALLFAGGCSVASLVAIGGRYLGEVDKRHRKQAGTLLLSIGQATILVLLTSVFTIGVPSHLTLLLSCFTAVAGISYAIAFHGLFDIKLLAVRAAAYIVTLLVIAVVLIAPVVFTLSTLLNLRLQSLEFIGLVAMGVVTLSIALYLKKIFDKITNSMFYRYYYDPQDVLDQLNAMLTQTSDMRHLLERSSAIISGALKPTTLSFVTETFDTIHDPVMKRALFGSKELTILADELDEESDLRRLLKDRNIALVVRLEIKHENQGFMLLGDRRSGEEYTSRDVRMLRVAAGEIAIGVQNVRRFEEIKRFNETLQQKVEDATLKLRASNKKLKQLNDSKDDFIGMASHQLRTPLTSIKGYVSLVMDGDAGKINATQRKLLAQAFSSSQKMVYLVADLLNVSRLKTGKFTIERKPTDLVKLVKEEAAQLAEELKQRGLALSIEETDKFPILPLDDTKTRQVVMNFLDNAVYYTPSGGHIRIVLKELPKSVEVRVIDDGIGVPKSEWHQLFTKFYRAKNAQRTRPDGTGLGLYMARKVITAQGGAIIFDSKEGEGSTFGFTFPKDLPTEPVVLPALAHD